ncbi:hypothetical protein GCM10007863_34640 [Dyella mobilis]|nr:hypothetical protein GCM10007863_34640 [Dyella mobilis]
MVENPKWIVEIMSAGAQRLLKEKAEAVARGFVKWDSMTSIKDLSSRWLAHRGRVSYPVLWRISD